MSGIVVRIVLGAVYLAMAAGQLASLSSMPRILGAYDAAPAAIVPWLPAGMIAAELLTGVWFLARPRSSALTPVWAYTAVALVWTVLGVQAYARGLTVDNCGCFDRYLTQRLSWYTILQDGLLLVYAAILIRIYAAGVRGPRQWQTSTVDPCRVSR